MSTLTKDKAIIQNKIKHILTEINCIFVVDSWFALILLLLLVFSETKILPWVLIGLIAFTTITGFAYCSKYTKLKHKLTELNRQLSM